MKTYTLYFSIFGKRMKHTLKADNEIEAKILIREKILFHKIEIERGGDIFDFFKGFDTK
jgi:hypothetical protein